MIKLSEQVRRLEDTIESLRAENKKLRNWIELSSDERDEIIDHQKWEIAKLKEELWARVGQVENLQDTLKKITKENLELQEKLNKGCCNKKCKKDIRDDDIRLDDNFRKIFWDFFR